MDVRSFAQLPGAIRAGLAGEHARVVVVLLDGFGWRFVQRHAGHPLLRRLARDGTLAPAASQFPATTTAHVTTMSTGLPVGRHGLYEWRIWEPSLRRLVTPLLFSWAGDTARDTLAGSGLDAGDLLGPGPTFYETLAGDGIVPFAFQPAAFSPSTYDGVALRGARHRPYDALAAGLRALRAEVAAHERSYAYCYFEAIDTAGHRHGPSSAQFDATAVAALDAIEACFFGPGAAALPGTLLVLTADHGQVDVHPDRVDALDELWPALTGLLEHDATGAPIGPAGSARDVFLHVRADAVEEVVGGLGAALGERGEVVATQRLLDDGAFGPEVGPRLLERLARVCVLPAHGRMAWLRSDPGVERRFLGHHGGRHPDEAQTFVGTIELD